MTGKERHRTNETNEGLVGGDIEIKSRMFILGGGGQGMDDAHESPEEFYFTWEQ